MIARLVSQLDRPSFHGESSRAVYLLSRAESLMSLVSRVRMVAAGISSQNTPSILHTACEERRKKTQYSHREAKMAMAMAR